MDVAHHPDPRADRVVRQVVDAELVQAIDRIRPIFKSGPLSILVMCARVLDLTVDRVVAWSDHLAGGSRIERALETRGVVPLSAREAALMLPEIWADKRTAARDLSAISGEPLGRVDKAHPAMDGGELPEAEEAFGGLVVAGGDAVSLALTCCARLKCPNRHYGGQARIHSFSLCRCQITIFAGLILASPTI
jgi:hypothetical protein